MSIALGIVNSETIMEVDLLLLVDNTTLWDIFRNNKDLVASCALRFDSMASREFKGNNAKTIFSVESTKNKWASKQLNKMTVE